MTLPTHLTWLDAVIVLCIGFGFLAGCKKGIVRPLLGIVGILAGLMVGLIFWEPIARLLDFFMVGSLGWPWRGALAFIICLLVCVITASLLANFWEMTSGTTISIVNQAFGGVFGVARSVLGLVVCFAIVGFFWPVIAFDVVVDSHVAIYFAAFSLDFISLVWPLLPEAARIMIFGF